LRFSVGVEILAFAITTGDLFSSRSGWTWKPGRCEKSRLAPTALTRSGWRARTWVCRGAYHSLTTSLRQ
jgi:hypothetical protein